MSTDCLLYTSIHEMFLIYLGTMTLTAFIGVSLSLLVSVFAKTERAALNLSLIHI